MLSERDNKILKEFASKVRMRFSDAGIWAFGSRARGVATQESDLDVCVVVEKMDDSVDMAIMDIAWEVGFKYDVIISTVTYSRQEFENGPCSVSTLVQNIMNAGVAS